MKNILPITILLVTQLLAAQVGINTTDPKGSLHIESVNNTGLVLPRVSDLASVTDGDGNAPLEGTTVYDLSQNATCFYQNGDWVCISRDADGNPTLMDGTPPDFSSCDYIKSSQDYSFQYFGYSLALSADGNTLAIGSYGNRSNATGVNGDQANTSLSNAGAVFVWTRSGDTWVQEAFLKSINPENTTKFGWAVSISDDGNTLAVGEPEANGAGTGIDPDPSLGGAADSGAAYIFQKTASTWSRQAYIKASNTDAGDEFGYSVALSGSGDTLAVGAINEDGNTQGIGGNQANNVGGNNGAVYVFARNAGTWTQQEYIKSSNNGPGDFFWLVGGAFDHG